MKKLVLIFTLLLFSNTAFAVELICRGGAARMQNQKPVYVDCSDRRAVISALERAWRELRRQRIGGSTENMCWRPLLSAEEMHPSIPFDGIAQTFFMECNMALQYIDDLPPR